MADGRIGAANAAAIWCSNNFLIEERCTKKKKARFKYVLESVILRKFNLCANSDEPCVIQIEDNKPSKMLEQVMELVGLSTYELTSTNTLVMVFHNSVWVSEGFKGGSQGAKKDAKCIYMQTISHSK